MLHDHLVTHLLLDVLHDHTVKHLLLPILDVLQEKWARKKEKKLGVAVVLFGKCTFFGGGKCPNLGVANVRILEVVMSAWQMTYPL